MATKSGDPSNSKTPTRKQGQRRRTIIVDGPHPIDIYVGSRIRLQRLMRGLTQSKLAKRVGISFQSVQKYERGENRVSASRLHEFATALAVPEQFFFEGVGVEAPMAAPVRDSPGSVVEGEELHRQLLAVLSIDDKRIRGLMIHLLKILSELGGVKVQRGT